MHVGTDLIVVITVLILVAIWPDIFHDPGVDSPIAVVLNLGLARGRLQLYFARLRYIDFKTVFVDDYSLRESVLIPEVPRGQRCHDARDGLVFQCVSGPKRGHRDVPLPVVAVHRSFS